MCWRCLGICCDKIAPPMNTFDIFKGIVSLGKSKRTSTNIASFWIIKNLPIGVCLGADGALFELCAELLQIAGKFIDT